MRTQLYIYDCIMRRSDEIDRSKTNTHQLILYSIKTTTNTMLCLWYSEQVKVDDTKKSLKIPQGKQNP